MRVIDADPVLETLKRWLKQPEYSLETKNALACAINEIEEAPIIGEEPTARWKYLLRDSENEAYMCTNCGAQSSEQKERCPYCKAKMDIRIKHSDCFW